MDKRIEEITQTDIQELIDNQVSEGKTLDYKEGLPGNDNEAKSEFLRDVSAFANASGGDIIYGVVESRDEIGTSTGIPERIVGLANSSLDAEMLRLEQILRAGLEPRIPILHLKPVDVEDGTKLLVIRIGDSWLKPHHICFRASHRYYVRTNAGKQPLNYQEIREAILRSAELPKRMREFRDQRLSTILSGDLLFELPRGPILLLHFLPLESFRSRREVDLTPYVQGVNPFPGSSGITGFQRPNLDGVVFFNLGGGEIGPGMYGFTQLYRSGAIEIVDGSTIYDQGEHGKIIGTTALERAFYQAINSAMKCLRAFGIKSDVYLFLSLMNIKGFRLYEQRMSMGYGLPKQADRNHLLFPEVEIRLTDRVEVPLRQVCDQFWQAFGALGSTNFDEEGNWTAH